jgi:lycopene beta-cyclase
LGQTLRRLEFDYLIAGAGASGLLLALELKRQGLLKEKSLCLIERDRFKRNDRTWCFWSKSKLSNALEQTAGFKWSHCFSEGQLQNLAPYQYYHIRSEDFYTYAWRELQELPTVTNIIGSIVHVEQNDTHVEVVLPDSVIHSKWLFNSVPALNKSGMPHIRLWQSFYGWRVKFTKRLQEPLPLILMDFDLEQQHSTQFMYLLPFGNQEALFELTRFGAEPLQAHEAENQLRNYLSRYKTDYTIEELEVNQIPMSQAFDAQRKQHRASQRIVPIGSAAGALKPSSGYGFLKMQAHAKAIVEALHAHRPVPTIYRKKRFRLYDALLLQILEKKPQQGRLVFKQLFKRIPTPMILKFLDEETHIFEEMRIFSRLPIMLFLRQLILYSLKK